MYTFVLIFVLCLCIKIHIIVLRFYFFRILNKQFVIYKTFYVSIIIILSLYKMPTMPSTCLEDFSGTYQYKLSVFVTFKHILYPVFILKITEFVMQPQKKKCVKEKYNRYRLQNILYQVFIIRYVSNYLKYQITHYTILSFVLFYFQIIFSPNCFFTNTT